VDHRLDNMFSSRFVGEAFSAGIYEWFVFLGFREFITMMLPSGVKGLSGPDVRVSLDSGDLPYQTYMRGMKKEEVYFLED
jgi:hypothetical protein